MIISSVSRPILEEVERVLLTKFLWSDDRVQEALSTIRAITEYVWPTEALAVVTEDPDDDRILEAAVAGLSEIASRFVRPRAASRQLLFPERRSLIRIP